MASPSNDTSDTSDTSTSPRATPPAWVVDTDCGVDDAQALFLVLRAHERGAIRLVGVTCVGSNVGLELVVGNVCAVLHAFGPAAADVPVYAGACQPLVQPAVDASHWHGVDGLGDTGLGACAPRGRVVAGELAAAALARLAAAHAPPHGGGLHVLTLGPLTNLATALARDSSLPSRVPRLVVMGGAYSARGNVGGQYLAAEYNVHGDVEAAAAVFAARWAGGVVQVSWELALACSVDGAFMRSWLSGATQRSTFLRDVTRRSWLRWGGECSSGGGGDTNGGAGAAGAAAVAAVPEPSAVAGYEIADPVAAAVAMHPHIVTRSVLHGVVVETGGVYSRGQTLVDWSATHAPAHPQVSIVQALDAQQLRALLLDSVR